MSRIVLWFGAVLVAAPGLWLAVAPPAAAVLGPEVLLDATSRLFLLLVQVLFLGVVAHVATGDDPEGLSPYLAAFGFPFLLACDVAIAAESPVLSWSGLELSTLFAAPLVVAGRPERTWGSFQYFLFSSVGLGLVLLGFTFLEIGWGHEGPFTWTELLGHPPAPSPWVRAGALLALAGYGAKLGLFPLNPWVPVTYATAPGPVAALLGAIQFNAALVGLLRTVALLHGPLGGLVSAFLLGSGLATMAVSTLGIVGTRDYLRLLGYGSVNHAGVIAVGLGLGGPAAYGVLVYAVSNAFIKAILFLAAARVHRTYGTTDARKVRGLVKRLPYNGLLLMVGTFALLGLPPFGSFLGELLVLSAVVTSGWTALLLPFCALLVLSFVATGRTLFPMIWGHAEGGDPPGREPLSLAVPKVGFLVALVALGLYVPAPVNALLREVAAALGAP